MLERPAKIATTGAALAVASLFTGFIFGNMELLEGVLYPGIWGIATALFIIAFVSINFLFGLGVVMLHPAIFSLVAGFMFVIWFLTEKQRA